MATSITYNGKSLPSPLPLVSREDVQIRYGEKWGTQYRYTLDGYLINCSGYAALVNQQQQILNIFNKDFQAFTVTDTNVNISHPICYIENIEFGASDYLYNIPYSVSLATYDQSSFEANGILDPINRWEFQETDDHKILLTHEIGARGFNTSDTATNALRNAINFVQQRSGLSNQPSLQFITGAGEFVLKSQEESLNRLNASYSITERYEKDALSDSLPKRYTLDIASGLEGFINVDINGSIEGGIDSSLNSVRNEYHNFNIWNVVYDFYTGNTSNTDLNINPLASGIVEDPYKKIINFNLSYDNNPNPLVSLDYSVDVQDGENDTIISVAGNIVGRGDMSNRWANVQNYYNTDLDMYALATSGYIWNGGAYSVNPAIVSSGVVSDAYKGTISFRGTYNDRPTPPANFKDFDYTISFKPSIRQISTAALFTKSISFLPAGSDEHYLTDLGYHNKIEMTINGTATMAKVFPTDTSVKLVDEAVADLFWTYGNGGGARTNRNITFLPPFGQRVSFNYSWVFDGTKVNDSGNYSTIINLNTKS